MFCCVSRLSAVEAGRLSSKDSVLELFLRQVGESTPLIVLSTGPQADALEDLKVPRNAICMPEVPQVDLLRMGVDLFLSHFGQNSFMESLSLGVPMVGCPGFVDQPANAKKAEAMGVALQVDRPVPLDGEEPAALEKYQDQVSEALRRVYHEPQFRGRAREVARGIQEAGGVQRAVEILLGCCEREVLPKLLGHQGTEILKTTKVA